MKNVNISNPVPGRYELEAHDGYMVLIKGTKKRMKTAIISVLDNCEIVADEAGKPVTEKKRISKRRK